MKLIESTTTKVYKAKNSTIIHTKTMRKPQYVYFSGNERSVDKWDSNGGYIDLAPKGNLITRFLSRLKVFKQLKQLFPKV